MQRYQTKLQRAFARLNYSIVSLQNDYSMGNVPDPRLVRARERALRAALLQMFATLDRLCQEQNIATAAALSRATGLSPNVAAKVLRHKMKDPPLSTLLTLMAVFELRSLEEVLAPLGSTAAKNAWDASLEG